MKKKRALPPTIPVEPEYPPPPPGTPENPFKEIPFICAVLKRIVVALDDRAADVACTCRTAKRKLSGLQDDASREAVARALAMVAESIEDTLDALTRMKRK
jgi:hypothetical protein